MFDPATISAALASAKTILDLLKNANDAQLALKIGGEIANLQGRLIDVHQQALTLQNEQRIAPAMQLLPPTQYSLHEVAQLFRGKLVPF